MSSRDEDIVDYLLDELSPADRARVERAMSDDPALRDEVDRMRPLVADLDALPEGAWGGGHEAIPPLPPLPPLAPVSDLGERRAARRLSLRPAVAVAASVAALAVGIAIGVVVTSDDPAPSGPEIALERFGEGGPDASGVARVVSSDGEQLRLSVDGLSPSEGGLFYELWLLDGPEKAVSLGSFRVPDTGTTQLSVPLPFSITDFRYIDVSIEPEDGVATHSGRSVLRAPTAV